MSFPRYPEYKDSGVEWLGEVPGHWDAMKLGHTLKSAPCYGVLVPDFEEDGVPMLRITDMENGNADRASLNRISKALSEQYSRTIIEEGDVVLSVVGTIGEAFQVDSALAGVNLSRAVARIQPSNDLAAAFLCWVFQTIQFRRYVDLICVGTAQRVLNMGDLSAFQYAKAPIDEQTKIANFLDRETAKIDALVAEQRRLMALLKEKRQAVISHAVTRGLNPNAPMKPSGIEWLGDVPEHWRVVPLRWAAKVCSGDGLSSTEVEGIDDNEHAVGVIGGNGLMGYTDKSNVNHSLLAVGRVGALCGNVHLVHPPAWITDNALILDPDCSIFDLQFLSMTLRSRNLNDIASKTAQPLITGTQVSDQRIPCPPLPEQESIAAYLAEESAKFETLTTEAQRAIDLLQERRTALISAAVTGQIDVRGAL